MKGAEGRALERTQQELDREARKSREKDQILLNYKRSLYEFRWQITLQSKRTAVRSNEQMIQSMRGTTMLLGSMNRHMNLPAIQRITMEFEWEMDQRNKMIDDVIDAATGLEDEGASEDIVKEVLDGIGIDLSQAMGETPSGLQWNAVGEPKVARAIGGRGPPSQSPTIAMPSIRFLCPSSCPEFP
ncbi:ESCRT-III subunit protein did4 [Elaphomyces granulatus]